MRLIRLVGVVVGVLLFASPAGVCARPATSSQEVARLLTAHKVRPTPGDGSPVGRLEARRPITRGPTVAPVVGHATSADDVHWLQIMLPGRPNGSTGWIRRSGTAVTRTRWRVVVRIATRRVLVYNDGRLARSLVAIVGKPATPTPVGSFFVEESVRMSAASAGGPFALALSARSDVLQEFEGGPGQIAIHGMEGLVGTLGTAASHGCVRMSTPSIKWLVEHVTPGAPVTITS